MPLIPVLLLPPDRIAGTDDHDRQADAFFAQALAHRKKLHKEDEEILLIAIRTIIEED